MAELDAEVTFCYFSIYRPKTRFFIKQIVLYFFDIWDTCQLVFREKAQNIHSVT